ncbi:cache domain-containing protein, partial [Thalassospira sp. MCCC 1A02491]
MLQNIRIGKKVASLSLLSLVALLLIAALELQTLRSGMLEDRKDKIQTTVSMLVTAAQSYQDRVNSGELTQEAATTEFYRWSTAARFDDGTGYFFAYDKNGINKLHGAKPSLNGTDMSQVKDPTGNFIVQDLLAAAQNPEGGFFSYYWPKPGEPEEKLFEKLSYSAMLPWGDAIGTGIYIDDVDAAFWEQAVFVMVFIAIVVALMIALSLAIGRNITVGLNKLSTRMTEIANGKLEGEIEGQDRGDEVGDMARTVVSFRQQALENRELQDRQKQLEIQADKQRRKDITDMADSLEQRVKNLIRSISTSIAEMKQATSSMQEASNTNSQLSAAVASATTQTSTNVQTVSAATEELTASSDEIAHQIAQSADIANQANEQAARTNETVTGLADAAQKIGDVAKLIGDIAEQTNL